MMIDAIPHNFQYNEIPAEVLYVDERYPGVESYTDLTMDHLYYLVDYMQQHAEKLAQDEFSHEEESAGLRKIAVQLAHLGSLQSTTEDLRELNYDIIELFREDEQDVSFEYRDGILMPRDHYAPYRDQYYLSKSFWKKVKDVAHKVEKFLRKHKKEILIGAAVAVGVGVAAYAVIGACAASEAVAATAAAAAGGSAASAAPKHDHDAKNAETRSASEAAHVNTESPAQNNIDSNSNVTESIYIESVIPTGENKNETAAQAWDRVLNAPGRISSTSSDLTFSDSLKKFGERLISDPVHEVWHTVGSLAIQAGKEVETISDLIPGLQALSKLHPSAPDKNLEEAWRERLKRGHEAIDEWFATSFRHRYREDSENRFIELTYPDPLIGVNILKEVEAAAKVTDTLRKGKAFADEATLANKQLAALKEAAGMQERVVTAAEGTLSKIPTAVATTEESGLVNRRVVALDRARVMENGLVQEQQVIDHIHVRPDGIWEIDGKNIKRFNLQGLLEDDNKMKHLFDQKHNLNIMNSSRKEILNKVSRVLIEADRAGKIPLNQVFELRVSVQGIEVEVRGIIVDGDLRYGTIFIPE
jgi:hypothetical protein